MTAFLILATLLALGAAALIAVPLLRPRADRGRPAVIAASVSVVLVLAGAAALYPTWSTWSWEKPIDDVSTPEGMVGRLARRLEKQPDDLNGWLMLGRSYAQLGQYALSAKAYRRADRLAEGRSADALAGLAESLVLGDESDLKGEAGRLFEKALEIEPRSIKALFYGAVAALDRGESQLARSRFQLLLTGNPTPEVRRLIEQQIQALDVELAQRSAPAPAESAGSAATAAVESTLRLRVSLDPSVASKVTPGAPLFVSVRIAGQGGPPFAARRLEAKFPQDVDLSTSDAMIAGRTFSVGQDVEITARVANGGSAAARSGDPVGTLRHTVAKDSKRLSLTIGSLTP
jgi:cytochrome c-type biogenesis protein CcmH